MQDSGNPNSAFTPFIPIFIPTVDGVFESPFLPVEADVVVITIP